MTRARRVARRLLRRTAVVALAAAGVGVTAGCEVASFLNPAEVVDPKKRNLLQPDGSADPVVQVILDELDLGLDAPEVLYPDARDVTAADLEVVTQDYRIGSSDLLRVSISDFPVQGARFTDAFRVTDTGNINLPDVNEVRVSGLTETEAAQAIADRFVEEQILAPGARVNVLVADAQNRVFTAIGRGVARAGRYTITQPDLRLLDALALAAGITDARIANEYAFILRPLDDGTATPSSQGGQGTRGNQGNQGNQGGGGGAADPLDPLDPFDPLDPLAPREGAGDLEEPGGPGGPGGPGEPGGLVPGEQDVLDPFDPIDPQGDSRRPGVGPEVRGELYAMQTPAGGVGGRIGRPIIPDRDADLDGDRFEFDAPPEPDNIDKIRVPLRELLNGSQRFNVVIRPGDTLVIPAEIGGFYYVYGNALQPGVFQINPGTDVTLKRAIASARGFNAVAIPQRTQIVRKIGRQDVFFRVNLKKIFVGQEPDLVVKPDDMIMVGTNFPAPFLASLRNGFRVTYGFGFLYDRNFARDRQNQTF